MKKPSVAERRTEILEVTCEVVIERGFAGTRISDVAKRLDVSTSLIHYHFDSKEQLLAEAFAHYARKDLAAMEAEIDAAPTALEQLDRIIHDNVPEGSGDMEWMLWIDAWGEALRNPLMRTISQELDDQSMRLVTKVLEYGVATEEFDCPDPTGTALRLTALIDGLAVQFAAHDHVLTREDVIASVRRLAASEVGVPVEAFAGVVRPVAGGLRPPSPAIEAALRRVVATANDAVLRRDAQAFAGCFVDDGVWDSGRGRHEGRAAIAAGLTKLLKDHAWISPTAPQYVFEVDEHAGTGIGRGTVRETSKRLSGKIVETVAVNHDQFIRSGGVWRLADRRVEILDRG